MNNSYFYLFLFIFFWRIEFGRFETIISLFFKMKMQDNVWTLEKNICMCERKKKKRKFLFNYFF